MNKPKPAKSTEVSTVDLPAWVEEAGKENYDIVKGITGQAYQPYGGPSVANESNMTTQGYDYLMRNIGASDPMFQQAAGMLTEGYQNSGKLLGQGADYLNAAGGVDVQGQINPYFQNAAGMLTKAGEDIDVNQWLNPWSGEVEANAMRNLGESLSRSQAGQADAASAASAFGGSRHGIESAVLASEGAKKAGDLSSELRQKGWDTAVSNAFSDRKRQLDVGLGWGTTGTNLGGVLNNYQSNLTDIGKGFFSGGTSVADAAKGLAGGLTDVGKTRQETMLKDVGGMLAGGASEQAYNQAQIDADRSEWDKAQAHPLEMANARMAALGLTPYETTKTTKKEGTSESKGTDWMTTALGAAKLFLSDERDKTDIQKVGKEDGLDMYAFRYKGDPKSYPKVVGPMAQDVKKKRPKKVKKIGNRLAIKGVLSA